MPMKRENVDRIYEEGAKWWLERIKEKIEMEQMNFQKIAIKQ